MLVFSTQLCELLPLFPSLWFNSPPPPFSVEYYSRRGGGGIIGFWTSDRSIFQMTTFCIAFYKSYLSTRAVDRALKLKRAVSNDSLIINQAIVHLLLEYTINLLREIYNNRYAVENHIQVPQHYKCHPLRVDFIQGGGGGVSYSIGRPQSCTHHVTVRQFLLEFCLNRLDFCFHHICNTNLFLFAALRGDVQ